jgi:predicted O-linked N-acetylglucosamine transferase (SPINDLY family)
LRINPISFAAHNNRGNALNKLGRYGDAVATFDRAIAIKPDFAEAFNNRGNALREMKRFDAAIASYDRALSLLPRYPDALNNRGVAYADLGRYEEALASYDHNAHTTASDALWAGLPVLTCIGTTFCGRVAASLLSTLQLDDLITSTLQQYEQRAIELASDRDRLRLLGDKLALRRLTASLFDARRYTRHLETAHRETYKRAQSGRPPGVIFA